MSPPPLTDEQRAMVEANTGLVGFVLRRRHTPEREWDDAFQDGLIGLMRASQKFDPARGFQFSTYALWWIRQAVGRGRDVELGKSYRQARRSGTDYEAPLSLDVSITVDGNTAIGAALAGVDDTAEEAITSAEHGDLVARLLRACRDPLDVAIVEAACTDGFSRRRLAADHGVHVESIRQRTMRLASRSRHPTARTA